MTDIHFASPISIIDAAHPDHLDWRRVRLSLELGTRCYIGATIRRKKGGRRFSDLLNCPSFLCQLDMIAYDLLDGPLPNLPDLTLGRPLISLTARGGGDNGKSSPSIHVQLPGWIESPLHALTAHQHVALHARMNEVAARQERRRSRPAR